MPLNLWGFAAITVPLVATPGASTAVVLRNSLAAGVASGVATAIGVNTGSICYGLVTASYLLILPQFIPRDAPPVPSALTLTAFHVVLALSWHLTWAAAGGTLSATLSRTRPRHILEGISGVALLGLALKLLL